MNVILSSDIVGIIRKYLLPTKEIVKMNKKKCLRDVIKSTYWVEKDLLDISNGYIKKWIYLTNHLNMNDLKNFIGLWVVMIFRLVNDF